MKRKIIKKKKKLIKICFHTESFLRKKNDNFMLLQEQVPEYTDAES